MLMPCVIKTESRIEEIVFHLKYTFSLENNLQFYGANKKSLCAKKILKYPLQNH